MAASKKVYNEAGEVKCSSCGQFFPNTVEHFDIDKTCHGGLSARCRICSRLYRRTWEKSRSLSPGIVSRVCTHCNIEKPLAEFYARRGVKMSWCKMCVKQRHADHNYNAKSVERRKKLRENDPYHTKAYSMFHGMCHRAKRKGLFVDKETFSVAFITNWLHACPTCPCCSRTFDVSYRRHWEVKETSPSLDRFSLTSGYVIGNVKLICWRCNNLKRNASIEELQQVVDWMRKEGGV